MLRHSYFLTLDCRTNAHETELHHAFRKLAQHYHPDRLGPKALGFFTAIVGAYRALRNPDQRLSYAQGLNHGAERPVNDGVIVVRPAGEAPLNPEVPAVCPVIQVDAKLPARAASWDLIADRILRNFHAADSTPHGRAEAIDLQVQISTADALRGGIAVIEVPTFYPCTACLASGQRDGERCLECAERGLVEELEEVRVPISPLLADYTLIEIPAYGLGVHNFYLRLRFRVVANVNQTAADNVTRVNGETT